VQQAQQVKLSSVRPVHMPKVVEKKPPSAAALCKASILGGVSSFGWRNPDICYFCFFFFFGEADSCLLASSVGFALSDCFPIDGAGFAHAHLAASPRAGNSE
jgi:hypothetical protein